MTRRTPSHVTRIATIENAGSVRALAWSHSGQFLAAGDGTRAFRIWQIVREEPRLRLSRQLNGMPSSVSWSFDDQYVAFGLGRSGAEIWDGQRGLRVWPTLYADVSDDATCVTWDPTALRLAFGGQSGTVFFRDFSGGWNQPDDQIGIGHAYDIHSMSWCPQGGLLVTGTSGGTIGIWSDSDVDNQLRHGLSIRGPHAHDEEIVALAWSDAGGMLVSASADRRLRLWDMRERRCVGVVTLDETPLDVAFALDGRILVARCLDNLRFFRSGSLAEITAHRLDGSLDPHPTPTSFDGHSRLATIDTRTNQLVVLEVDFVGLLRFSEITSRPYRAAAVAVFGEARSGRTGIVSALTDDGLSNNSTSQSLRTSLLRLPRHESGTSEETREVALWDLPSSSTSVSDAALLHRIHAGQSLVTLLVLDISTAMAVVRDSLTRIHARRLFEAVSLTNKPILVAIARCDRAAKWPDESELAEVAKALGIERLLAVSGTTRRGIPELERAVVDAIDWQAAPCAASEDVFMLIRAFVGLERDRGKTLTHLDDLRDGFLRSNEFLAHRVPTKAEFATAITILEILGEVDTFESQHLVLLQPTLFHTYAAAMIAGARKDPKGMGRLPLKDARSGYGEQISVPELARLEDKGEERRILSVTIDELLTRNVAQEVSTNNNSYLVFPRSVDRVWQGDSLLSDRVASCRYEGAIDEVFSSLVVRFLALNTFYPHSELWKNAASFKALSGGTCGVVLRHDELANEGELTIFCDSEADDTTRQAFAKQVRDHLQAEGKNPRCELAAGEAISQTGVFFCHRLARDEAQSLGVIAEKLHNRGIRVWLEERDAHAGEAGRMRAVQLQSSEIAVVFLSGPLSAKLRRDCELLIRRGCAIVPAILPMTPRQFRLPELLARYSPVDFRQLNPDPIDRLSNGILELHRATIATERQASPRKKHVFVSYARDDLYLVDALVAGIRKHHDVWMDQQIAGGEDWQLAVKTAIDESYAVVVCLSNRTADVSGVNPEILMAIEQLQKLPPKRTFLIPVRLEPCVVPPFPLGGGRTLNDLERIDCFAQPPERSVLESLRRALDNARGRTR